VHSPRRVEAAQVAGGRCPGFVKGAEPPPRQLAPLAYAAPCACAGRAHGTPTSEAYRETSEQVGGKCGRESSSAAPLALVVTLALAPDVITPKVPPQSEPQRVFGQSLQFPLAAGPCTLPSSPEPLPPDALLHFLPPPCMMPILMSLDHETPATIQIARGNRLAVESFFKHQGPAAAAHVLLAPPGLPLAPHASISLLQARPRAVDDVPITNLHPVASFCWTGACALVSVAQLLHAALGLPWPLGCRTRCALGAAACRELFTVRCKSIRGRQHEQGGDGKRFRGE